MTGPLSGTNFPSANRMTVSALSPLTGIWGESNAGGILAPQIKFAGYDGIVIRNASPRPVYLDISEAGVQIRDAEGLWGLDTYQTYESLSATARRPAVACIGPAGEKLAPMAAIVHNRGHLFGRTGMGAVMGSKKLKAIKVLGRNRIPPYDPGRVREVRARLLQKQKDSLAIQSLTAYGTNTNMEVGPLVGDVPIKNWVLGEWDGIERINAAAYSETILRGTGTCYACPVACKRVVEVPDGPYQTSRGPGPEYETVANFGTMIINDDLPSIARANELCNRYGLDTISLGTTIAFAVECYQNGSIGARETGGIELRWSDPDLLIALAEGAGRAEGFGGQLARGSAALAREWGPKAQKLLSTVKGLEAPAHDPRGSHGVGLAYATSTRGACHVNCLTYPVESGGAVYPLLGLAGAPVGQSGEGKAAMVIKSQNFGQVFGCAAAVCHLGGLPFDEQDLLDMLNSATGWDLTLDELLLAGERIWCLKRLINNLRGVTSANDRLPEKLVTPLDSGPAAGSVPDLDQMLSEFYALRGLDESGRPSPEKLGQLGLKE